jgi:MYXO-CTERM domain-containing protein
MHRVLLLLALFVPALSRAQTNGTGTISFVPDANIGKTECDPANGETIDVRWTVTGTNPSLGAGTYKVYASTRAPTADTAGDLKLCDTGNIPTEGVFAGKIGSDIGSTSSTGTQNADLLTSDFVRATAAVDAASCPDDATRTIYVCVHFFPTGQGTATASATGQLELDLKVPAKPVNVVVTPGEEGLRVDWDEGTATGGQTDTVYYRIQAQSTDPRDTRLHDQGNFTGESGRVDGLLEGVTYQVTVIAFSAADNGNPSDPVPGTPVPVSDFFEHYEESGGREQGGCASGPAGALGLLGAVLALALQRRRQ